MIISTFPNAPTMSESLDSEGMTPTDFVLWLNGYLDVLNGTPPTQEQWDKLREKAQSQVGAIVAQRIRDRDAVKYDPYANMATQSYGYNRPSYSGTTATAVADSGTQAINMGAQYGTLTITEDTAEG